MKLLLVLLFAGLTGFISVGLGYGIETWQYWMISAPIAFGIGWFANDIVAFLEEIMNR